MYHTAKLFSDLGEDVLIGGILVERPGIAAHYARLRDILWDHPLSIVEVSCPLEICRLRNIARGDRYETQSAEQAALMFPDIQYVLRVETDTHSPEECVNRCSGRYCKSERRECTCCWPLSGLLFIAE